MDEGPAAFGAARLDEDEAAAKAGAEANETLGRPPTDYQIGGLYTARSEFIARHGPARALREAEAGRRILERHRDCALNSGYCRDRHFGPPPCPDLADLLAWWDDHPDYRQEWKP